MFYMRRHNIKIPTPSSEINMLKPKIVIRMLGWNTDTYSSSNSDCMFFMFYIYHLNPTLFNKSRTISISSPEKPTTLACPKTTHLFILLQRRKNTHTQHANHYTNYKSPIAQPRATHWYHSTYIPRLLSLFVAHVGSNACMCVCVENQARAPRSRGTHSNAIRTN